MGNLRGFGIHLIFVFAFLVAATCTRVLGDQNTSEQVKERLALLKFKHSVKDSYDMLSSWVGNDCCMWEGIHCDAITRNVESLHLRGNFQIQDEFVERSFFLRGYEVSSSLAELKHLKHLDLSGNYFYGSHIPKFIGSFKQLTYLNLSYSYFQGNISHHLGNLTNLKVLDLSSSERGLMVDDMAWISGLSSLELLDLSYVDLSRARNRGMVFYMIPSLQVLGLSNCGLSNADLIPFRNSSRILPNIKHLDLGINSFQGPLPSLFRNLSSLTFLDLSSFNLGSAWNFANLLSMIPSLSELHLSHCGLYKTHLSSPRLNFSTLSNIQHLDLSQNSIGSTFPSILTNMSSLRFLDLSYNMLSSSVPFMPNLLNLDLSHNQFKHIGDVGIWRLCHLKRLDASSNQFEKDVTDSPKNVSECSQYALEWLGLSQSLNGTISKAIGRLHNLRVLDLSSSSLTGFIPESLRGLRYLEVLDLSDNELTGPIPTFHANLSKLKLSYNHLNGSIPKSIGNQVALTYLDLTSNRLTGPIPISIGRLVSLQVFSVARNMLSGTIPVTIGQLAKLHSLDFSNNYFEGVVSKAHFGNLSMLKELHASFNTNLTFNASHEWILPCQLVSLYLSSCNIANGFPHWLRNQRNLEDLVLSNASISGSLPKWLRKMPIIRSLDLSHNKLRGPLTNLPNGATYGSLLYPSYLFLQDNSFNESIPRSLCKRTDLVYLDFSNNRLTGTLPDCLKNLQYLESIVVSSNQLSGVIPSFKDLLSLRRLNLHDNNFVGKLPRELGNLPRLSILDVGENKLSGNIPGWIGEKLKRLVVLRLHKNNFTGRIPESLCKASNLHVLDVAHNNLKGPIPRCLGELNAMSYYNESRLDGFYLNNDEQLVQVMKGVDLEYQKTWKMVYNMDLSSNKLVGEIPVELTALSMLIGLNLSNNHLNGSIPSNIGNLTKLEYLDLSRNELTRVIPQSMVDLTFLSYLNLSHNNLSGRIPTGCQLQTLDASIYEGNKGLCGPPLSNNCSNPDHPPTTTTTSKKKHKGVDVLNNIWLFYLDVISGFATGFWGVIGVLVLKKQWRHNLFRSAEEMIDKIYVAVVVGVARIKRRRDAHHSLRTLPECLKNLQQLVSIVVSSNQLSGVIPSFKGLISLERLDLHDNFVGKFPRELRNLPDIRILDVGENNLTGNIPEWIGEKLKYLVVLRLHKNSFTRRIPVSLCKASKLQILDVAHNNLKGPIPRCLGELNAMSNYNESAFVGSTYYNDQSLVQVMKGVDLEYKKTWRIVYNMDLSSNKLVGEIPVELTALSMLIGLNLFNNHLNGSIPNNIGNLTKLESLDLSGNELIGVIPQSMADLTFLSHLNLSHNNLSGRIPTGRQLQTLTDPSIYEGNKDLCGAPLSNNCSNPEDSTTTTTSKKKHKGVDVLNNLWLFYLDVISGFATRFWGVIGVLVLKKQWRRNLFRIDICVIYICNIRINRTIDLSHNNLSGRIPTGRQLQTLTDPSIYEGNKDLCGPPLSDNCSNPEDPPTSKKKHKGVDVLNNLMLFYLDVISGFATGFWGVIGVLVLKKQWRHNLFRSAEEIHDKIYVTVIIGVAKIKRRR
ncbi:hypothetical protein LXL04_021796 [Taraxacum kok-saghyz]